MVSCFGEYWDGTADSECRDGEGCAKINECLAAFATGTLAGYQKGLGPKKATPEELSKLTSVRPEAILLAINFQHNTNFNPYGNVEAEEPKRKRERVSPEEKLVSEVPVDENKNTGTVEAVETVKEDAVSGNQFCAKCRGTGKRGRGLCRACQGTGRAQIDGESEVLEEVATGTAEESVDSTITSGDEVIKGVEGEDIRSDSAVGVLPVSGKEVSHVVLNSGGDHGDKAVTGAEKSEDRRTLPRYEAIDDHGRLEILPPSLPKIQGNGAKKQVVVDMYNKRRVNVTWPGYPTLMETEQEKIVQIIAWDTMRKGWVRLVPILSGDPDEMLYSSLFQG